MTDAHSRMVKDLFLSVEKNFNRKHSAPPEYDLQNMIVSFYEDWFRNTKYRVARECEGKVDVVIYCGDDVVVLYELKTFFKTREKIKENVLSKDIIKLKGKLVEMTPLPKAYIIVAGLETKLAEKDVPEFVSKHREDSRLYCSLSNIVDLKLRPSRKQSGKGVTFVMTWEISNSRSSKN